MTKKELLGRLASVPDDAELYLLADEFGTWHPITGVRKEVAAWYLVDVHRAVYGGGEKIGVAMTREKELHTWCGQPLKDVHGHEFLNTVDIWTLQ